MSHIYSSVEAMIGHTPLVELTRLEKEYGLKARLLAKLEGKNPGGSSKDRVALEMIEDAERTGLLKPDSVLVEPTSGNTGIGLALIAAVRGYRAIIVMPDSMSPERIQLLRAYGAEVLLTPGADGMSGAIAKAEELKQTIPNVWIPGQFSNPSNPRAHYLSTGPEIWEDTDGIVDAFVAGIGTGGTISGCAAYLKEKKPEVKIIGVEPSSSPLLTRGYAGSHNLQGIGANFIPSILDRECLDDVMAVSEEEAYEAGRRLARKEGILSGISAGAALYAAMILAAKDEYRGKTVVVLLPDLGDRYLSTELYKK